MLLIEYSFSGWGPPSLATLAAQQKGSFLWRVTTIWRESTVVRGTLTYLMRNSKARSGWEGLKSIIRLVAGKQQQQQQEQGSVVAYLRRWHSLWLGLCLPPDPGLCQQVTGGYRRRPHRSHNRKPLCCHTPPRTARATKTGEGSQLVC